MKKFLGVAAILAGAAGAVYSIFLIGFVVMMRGWSHVKDPSGDAALYTLFGTGLIVSALAVFWGVRQLRSWNK